MQVAAGAGMVPSTPAVTPPALPAYVSVFLDGRLIGYIQSGALLHQPFLAKCALEFLIEDSCRASGNVSRSESQCCG